MEALQIKNTIINLKIISKLQPHMRLDTSSTLYRIYDARGIIPIWAIRWWAGYNRKQDISRLSTLYEKAIEIARTNNQLVQLSDAVKNSISGLENLKVTYEDDLTIVSNLEYIVELIKSNDSGQKKAGNGI
jgi:hypothetical protein